MQTSLFSQPEDGYGPSPGFDLFYGYRNRRTEMTVADIEESVREFGRAARRVRQTGADGVEVTASNLFAHVAASPHGRAGQVDADELTIRQGHGQGGDGAGVPTPKLEVAARLGRCRLSPNRNVGTASRSGCS